MSLTHLMAKKQIIEYSLSFSQHDVIVFPRNPQVIHFRAIYEPSNATLSKLYEKTGQQYMLMFRIKRLHSVVQIILEKKTRKQKQLANVTF